MGGLGICPKNCRGGAFAPEILGGARALFAPPEYAPARDQELYGELELRNSYFSYLGYSKGVH